MLKILSMLLRSFFQSNSRHHPKKKEGCVMSTTFGTLQTMTQAYRQICGGEEPWIALGNFRNAWYGNAKDRRVSLLRESVAKSTQDTELSHRWSAVFARTVEFPWLRDDVPCRPRV